MRPVFIGASPNTQFDDVRLAFKLLLSPWSWKGEKKVREFEQVLGEYHANSLAVAFDSGRSALFDLLRAYGIRRGDEVLIPAFTCLAVVNPIIWVGAKPVYVDIGNDFNIDLKDLKSKLSPSTKAVIVQHTFGLPVDVQKVREIVGEDVKIIEDSAHSLGGELNGQRLGTLGDAAILTFGVEKVISSTRGGMIVTMDSQLAEKLRNYQSYHPHLPSARIFRYIINPIIWWLITPIYYWGFGRFTLGRLFVLLARKLKLIGSMIEGVEYEAGKPGWIPARLPGALATLGLHQFKKLQIFNDHRARIATIYSQELAQPHKVSMGDKQTFLRYPTLVRERDELLRAARKSHIILGEWYRTALFAPESSWGYFGYSPKATPNTAEITRNVVNLPTAINTNEQAAYKIAAIVKPYLWK